MNAQLKLSAKHFNPIPWDWSAARNYVSKKLGANDGSQGSIFSCTPAMEGAVAKLYRNPRPLDDLSRVQQLIRLCSELDSRHPATPEWFRRLNLPMRPILRDGQFYGVILPPLPDEVNTYAYKYDSKKSRVVKTSDKIRFEAQILRTRGHGPVGPVSEVRQWRILYSLAETVALMHTANLAHGDLSLNNVLVQCFEGDYTRDHVYLIDIDDAFLHDSSRIRPATAVRKSRSTFDPYSVEIRRVSKKTDVFVVALWVVAFMQGEFSNPAAVAREVPSIALTRLRRIDDEVARIVTKSLSAPDSRPPMVDFYLAIREAARKVGAV